VRRRENRERQKETELPADFIGDLRLDPARQRVKDPDAGRLRFGEPSAHRAGVQRIAVHLRQQHAGRIELEVEVPGSLRRLDEEFDAAVAADRVLKPFRHAADIAVADQKEPVQPLAVILHPEPRLRAMSAPLGAKHIDRQHTAVLPVGGIESGVERGSLRGAMDQITHGGQSWFI